MYNRIDLFVDRYLCFVLRISMLAHNFNAIFTIGYQMHRFDVIQLNSFPFLSSFDKFLIYQLDSTAIVEKLITKPAF